MTIQEGTQPVSTQTVLTTPPPMQQMPLQMPQQVPQQMPVQQMPVAQAPLTPHVEETRAQSVSKSSRSRFEPDALVAAAIGLVIAVVGLIAVIRGGFNGPMATPVVSVLGFTHTTTLGMIEIGLGLALLLSGASRSRSSEMLFGIVLGVAGFVGAVQNESFTTSLALETAMAWLAALAGAVVVVCALVLPRFAMRSTSVHQS